MKKWLLGIWKDPVWSKVIAGAIIGTYLYIVSYVQQIKFTEVVANYWNKNIKLGYVLSALFLFYIIKLIFKFFKSEPEPVVNLKKQAEKNFTDSHYKIIDDNAGLLYRFKTYISHYTDRPFISDLVVYCNLHGQVPEEMNSMGCNHRGCQNMNARIDKHILEKSITSYLVADWEKINGR